MTKREKTLFQIFLILGFIGVGVSWFMFFMAIKPKMKKKPAPVSTPMVRVHEVSPEPYQVIVRGEGTVEPLTEIQLVPQVSGKIEWVSESWVAGGAFEKGDLLVRIDPKDYELAVTLARAAVADAKSGLQQIQEEAAVALEEWRDLNMGSPLADNPPPLVARKPQLEAARAAVAANEAELVRASLNLARTRLAAPFTGRISVKNVDLGQYVTPGQNLGTLYSTGAAEILIPLEDRDLAWFSVPGFSPGDGVGARAEVFAEIAGAERSWPGRVVRTEGRLDPKTRMVNVAVEVENPYATRPPLAAGLFVRVEIFGKTLDNAEFVPRAALHENDVAWVLDKDNRVRFRRITVGRRTEHGVLVLSGLDAGERVVVSPLKSVTEGMLVRVPETGNGKAPPEEPKKQTS